MVDLKLLHPVLDSLKASSFEWLRTLLFTFNSGDMDAFDKISASAPFQKMVFNTFILQLLFLGSIHSITWIH